ncbi:hypothetical protein FACS189479_01030 [Spirochaetia bacterium]|nr:hypothetical protein FACS189479_01030 [Spirochaetia bacterium]
MHFSEDKLLVNSKYLAEFQAMFSRAGELAIQDLKAKNIPITYIEDDKIIKEYSDGTKEFLGNAEPWVYVGKKKIPFTKG